jgi:hypothetical protein
MVGSKADPAKEDKAVQGVRDEILSGGLAPGTTVTVSGLPRRFGTADALMHEAVADLAEEKAGKRLAEHREKQEKVQRAKHLLRGLKLASKRGGSIKLADHINENGLDLRDLWLDDLIALGVCIENVRCEKDPAPRD